MIRLAATVQTGRFSSSLLASRQPFVSVGKRGALHHGRPFKTATDDVSKARVQADLQRRIHAKVDDIYTSLLSPIAARLQFDTPTAEQKDPMPMVLVLGNHSSGKSSFINNLLGKQVQKTGVATTDDGFTIISGGKIEEDRDGPALVLSPEWGFRAFEKLFGKTLVSHVQLKIRTESPLLERLILVDTPGMIDSPATYQQATRPYGEGEYDRGYDFQGVVRWFAERADVILLLFDPDKPGTTGETLDVLTSCLSDLDHKVLIVLNKVDQFQQVEDFARAYGSLCWNLSKVIPRKDLPRIFTMFLPVPNANFGPGNSNLGDIPMENFVTARQEVVDEVWRAPKRRIDNAITQLYDTARRLRMHAFVAEEARKDFAGSRLKWRAASASMFVTLEAGAAYAGLSNMGWEVVAGLSTAAVVGTSLSWVVGNFALQSRRKEILDTLTVYFERLYAKEIAERNQEALAVWQRVKPTLRTSLEVMSLDKIPKLKRSEQQMIDTVLFEEVPGLRSEIHESFSNPK